MLQGTLYSNGQDHFEDLVFSAREDLYPEDKTEQERIGSESRVEEMIT